MKKIKSIVKSMRPKQWVKNMFVFPALVFAGRFTDFRSLLLSFSAFFLFSFTASSIYLINDVLDRKLDMEHPKKKYRPIASGQLSIGLAVFISFFLAFGTLLISLVVSPAFTFVLFVYVVNNLLYSYYFKQVVILDILMIAFGFVLRAIGGAVAINVSISPWFLVITFLLTIFLAIMKRRQEFVEIAKNGGKRRKVLAKYSVDMLDQMTNVVLPSVLVSYVFYTFNTFHTSNFMITIPFVVYGIFRYLYLVHKKDMGESPTATLLSDLPLLITVVLWLVLSGWLIYYYE